MKVRSVVWVLLMMMVAPQALRAELTAFWQNNAITPAAITDDPALAGMQSWSIMVTNTEGRFYEADLRAMLPAGEKFYRNSQGGNFRPTVGQQNANPALSFHTYVTQPQHDLLTGQFPPIVFGGFPVGEPVSFGGLLDAIPGTFSVRWGDLFGEIPHPPTRHV